MQVDRLRVQQERLRVLLSGIEFTLQRGIELIEKQRATVEWLEKHGSPMTSTAKGLLTQMGTTVEIFRWQKTWLETFLRKMSHVTLDAQPHPWAVQPPPDFLSRICFELDLFDRQGDIANEDMIARAVDAAFARATARR